jgi:hypothetical protein
MSDAPFFVVGCVRSGTTLLQSLLDAHPRIAIPPESQIFTRFARVFDRYGDLRQPRRRRRRVADVLGDGRIQDWRRGVGVVAFCGGLPAPSLRGVLGRLFSLYAQREGKPRWGEKTPYHVRNIREIKTVFPEAKLIHLVRDGRDVAESWRRVFAGPNSIPAIARRWRRDVLAFHDATRWLDPTDFLQVRFEALVQSPEEQMRRIFAFLGEEPIRIAGEVPDSSARRYYVGLDSIHGSLKGRISAGKVGVYKTGLSRRDVALFEAVAQDALALYGYACDTDGTARPTAAERLRFVWEDRVMRYQRKLARALTQAEARKQLWRDLQLALRIRWGPWGARGGADAARARRVLEELDG